MSFDSAGNFLLCSCKSVQSILAFLPNGTPMAQEWLRNYPEVLVLMAERHFPHIISQIGSLVNILISRDLYIFFLTFSSMFFQKRNRELPNLEHALPKCVQEIRFEIWVILGLFEAKKVDLRVLHQFKDEDASTKRWSIRRPADIALMNDGRLYVISVKGWKLKKMKLNILILNIQVSCTNVQIWSLSSRTSV